jgi:hypothetical protein
MASLPGMKLATQTPKIKAAAPGMKKRDMIWSLSSQADYQSITNVHRLRWRLS